MSDEFKNTLNEIQTAVTELRANSELKFSELEKKGASDPLIDDKLTKINESINELQKKAARPALNGNNADANPADIEHKSAFDKWARKGAGEHELDALEKKSITIAGDGTQGGYALPKVVETGIYQALTLLSPIRANATVIQVSGDDYRFLAANGQFAAGWVGETDARPITATNTLVENKVPMGEIYANPAASQRALDDLAFNLDQYMIDQTSLSFSIMENAAFINGDGVNKPMGILSTTGIPSVKTGVAAALPTTADPYLAMIYTLPAAYREGAKFVASSTSLLNVRTLKNSQGSYIWQPSLVEGQPETIGGYGVIVAEEMPTVAANSNSIAFGNLKRGYLIADRIGIRTLRDPYSSKPYVLFYSTKRVGGMVKDKSAFVMLKTAA